jgi:hypothetical protein
VELSTFVQLLDLLIDISARLVLLKKATFIADPVLKENTVQTELMNTIAPLEQTILLEVYLLVLLALLVKNVMFILTSIVPRDSTIMRELVLPVPLAVIAEIM